MTPLVIFGASGHARVIADAALSSGRFTLVGMLDEGQAPNARVGGIDTHVEPPVLDQLIAAHPGLQGIVGVGNNALREKIVHSTSALSPGFRFATVIHPSTVIASDVVIGEGVFIAAGVVINCGTRIGAHVIVNTSASMDHDCRVEDFASVAPGVVLAGSVTVGRSAVLGIGACTVQNITIGPQAVVGAGAAVIRDVPAGATVVGVPARALPQSDRIQR